MKCDIYGISLYGVGLAKCDIYGIGNFLVIEPGSFRAMSKKLNNVSHRTYQNEKTMLKKMIQLLLLLLCLIELPVGLAATSTPLGNIATFVSVADIHFNPFSGCEKMPKPCEIIKKLQQTDYKKWSSIFEKYNHIKKATYYHDTHFTLFKATLAKLNRVYKEENPRFVMVLGDFLGHHFPDEYIEYTADKSQKGYERFVKKTMQFLAAEIAAQFPQTNIYPVVGNNDSYTGDYSTIPQGRFLREMAVIWGPLIKDKISRDSFFQTFPYAGYYTVSLPNGNRLIVLNTVLFSQKTLTNREKQAGRNQLLWLRPLLAEMSKKKNNAYLAYHIPIGIDALETMRNKFNAMEQFWLPEFTLAFKKNLKMFSSTIQGMFFGHLHVEALQILTYKKLEDVSAYLTPSISPVLGNQASFKVFRYQINDLKIIDSETKYVMTQMLSRQGKNNEK